jgi:selenocysteine-specific elongation factor
MNFRCVEASGTSFGFGWPKWQALAQSIVGALEDYHKRVPDSPGLEQDRLRRVLDIRLPGPAFDTAATAIVQDGILRCEGPWLKLPGHAVRLTVSDERLWVRIEQILECARFQPPRVQDFARMLGSRDEEVGRLLGRLTQMGPLVEVAHDRVLPGTALSD